MVKLKQISTQITWIRNEYFITSVLSIATQDEAVKS